QGMGHAVLIMPEIDAALTFYRDLLGFRITDFMGPPVSLYFMHVKQPTPQPRHCPRFKQPHAPSDDGVLLSRRCWPELRYRAAARSRRGKVRSASERFHDVILYAHAVAIPNRAWLGWPRSHPWLAASRAEIRRQLLGAPRGYSSRSVSHRRQ